MSSPRIPIRRVRRASWVQAVSVLQGAVARRQLAPPRNLVLRVRSATPTPSPRSLLHQLDQTLDLPRENITSTPSTTTLACTKRRKRGTARHGVGCGFRSGPSRGLANGAANRLPRTSLTCRSRHTHRSHRARLFGFECRGLVGSIGHGSLLSGIEGQLFAGVDRPREGTSFLRWLSSGYVRLELTN
jgi:hypothetical protein